VTRRNVGSFLFVALLQILSFSSFIATQKCPPYYF
jgi:hypothetical protein